MAAVRLVYASSLPNLPKSSTASGLARTTVLGDRLMASTTTSAGSSSSAFHLLSSSTRSYLRDHRHRQRHRRNAPLRHFIQWRHTSFDPALQAASAFGLASATPHVRYSTAWSLAKCVFALCTDFLVLCSRPDRFAKDMEGIDSQLPDNIGRSTMYFLSIITTILTITAVAPLFLLFFALLSFFYVQRGKLYTQTARELRRLDSISKSPLFSLYSEAIGGVAVIRAFGASDRFMAYMLWRAEDNLSYFYHLWVGFGATRWQRSSLTPTRRSLIAGCLSASPSSPPSSSAPLPPSCCRRARLLPWLASLSLSHSTSRATCSFSSAASPLLSSVSSLSSGSKRCAASFGDGRWLIRSLVRRD